MPSQTDITTLRNFAQKNDQWIIVRDDFAPKPTMLFKYPPGSWNIADDQIGIGDPDAAQPPYFFWAFSEQAQWATTDESGNSIRITGPVRWQILSYPTEEEADAQMEELQQK